MKQKEWGKEVQLHKFKEIHTPLKNIQEREKLS